MHKVERSALIMHSAKNMYDLVNDIDSYEKFLPWCGGSKVLETGNNRMVASIDIAFKGVHKTFTTANKLVPVRAIDMSLVDGPFSALTGQWVFKEISVDASRISLKLHYDFSNPLVAVTVGSVFKIIADSMVDAFCKRADQIYLDVGKKTNR